MKSRYYSYSRYLRVRFGCRVYRVPLDAGFSCPTRDGTLSTGGCLYCGERGSAASWIDRSLPVGEQLRRGMERVRRRYGAEKFIAYLQAFTNTYGPIETCERAYRESTDHEDVVGLAIGTRPDCVPDEIMDIIASFIPRYDTWIEYGLQSSHDSTLKMLRRGHTVTQFVEAVERAKARSIKVSAHVILGLPGESREMMLVTARFLASIPVDGVKIHLLHVLRGSPLAETYRKGFVRLLSKSEYVGLVCDFLELLPERVVIQRLTAEAPTGELVAPLWAGRKRAVIDSIESELERRDSRQGKMVGT